MIPSRATVLAFSVGVGAIAGCNAIFGITPGIAGTGGDGGGTTTSASAAGGATTSTAMSSTSSGEAPPPSKLIPAGTFDFLNEQTQKTTPATLSHDFYLDELEVTVARFKAWIDGGQKPPCASGTCTLDPGGPYETTMIWDSAWNLSSASQSFQDPASCGNAGSNTGPSDNHAPTWGLPDGATFPIGCLNWYQAVAFCASEGKRLPTETEWQYAASGRGLGRTYPWGNTEPVGCTQAIWNNGAAAPGFNGCGFPKVVGSVLAGASRDGVLDMAGSLYEWLWDFDAAYPDAATLDYPGPAQGGFRSTRGGAWSYAEDRMRSTYRDASNPDVAEADKGLRCAKTKLP
jgi:formylglycine-generating enzyme required for sulfatase activity